MKGSRKLEPIEQNSATYLQLYETIAYSLPSCCNTGNILHLADCKITVQRVLILTQVIVLRNMIVF